LAKEKAEAKIVKLVLVEEGTYDLKKPLFINCPISIHGAGQNNTILQRHGIFIAGTKKEKKRVDMQGMTMKGSRGSGLDNVLNGLSFLCKDMTFTQCGERGVHARNTKGRLNNCVITQCRRSGIWCSSNALIELEGDQTKVDGNVTGGGGYEYGLRTSDTSSIIHLLFPLTKESVSTNNGGSGNYDRYDNDTIETVESLEKLL
jgi:hypothetical protein